MDQSFRAPPIPTAFIWRKAHSLTGLWLVLFLIEHLFTNSQAALWIGEDGKGFVAAVNWIQNLPFLPVIEVTLLGIPFLIHAIWGVKYLLTARYNNGPSDGSQPSLPEYRTNQAYSWQRITSWFLLIAILAHVVQMRFIEYPTSFQSGNEEYYSVPISEDEGLASLSERLSFDLYQEEDQLFAITPSFGTAELLIVRNIFKNPIMILLYTGLVLAACFHAFNGLWTFMISWGITLTARSQALMRSFAIGLMILISFLGLAAIYGTYWINLRY